MPRELQVIADDAQTVLPALRAALSADGPAIMPLPVGSQSAGSQSPGLQRAGIPHQVERRIALVVQTSGSSGTPKRVALSADALLASAAATEGALGGPGQWLLALPAHYIAGVNVLVRSIAAETSPVLMSTEHFDPEGFVHAANRMDHPVRYTALVPAQLGRLLDKDQFDLDITIPALRRFDGILIGGQSLSQGLRAQASDLGLNVTRTYGSSETSGGCVYDGVPIGMTRVRVVDGQIELGGPTLAERYLDAELTTERFYTDDGMRWFRTGDTGEIVDGAVRVTGRLDDVIVSGGIKVSLSAVERVVRTFPGLSDAVVISGADAKWGEAPVVVATTPVDLALVRQHVEDQLGAAARPSRLVEVDAIPILASGKPDRKALTGR